MERDQHNIDKFQSQQIEEYKRLRIDKLKELDEQYEKDYLKLRARLMRDNIMSIDSSRNLRRKNPVTRRKRMPVSDIPEPEGDEE